jgi:hypothetical protein
MSFERLTCLLLPAIIIVSAGSSQTAKTALTPIPANQRVGLTSRLRAYTTAFREKDWAGLYDLVSDENKIRGGKLKVNRRAFIRDMQGTYDPQRLIKFEPLKTEVVSQGIFNIYGCGELPYGDEKIERIAAVRAVREHGNWYFTNWEYPDPPEPCSNLSDPAWKPARYLQQLDGPMLQVSCELNVCTL